MKGRTKLKLKPHGRALPLARRIFPRHQDSGEGVLLHLPSRLNPVKSTTFRLKKHPWSSLLKEGIIQQEQLFNVLERREKGKLAFNGPIVNLNALHLPCKKVTCEPTCWICYSLVDDLVPTNGFPGFIMHRACSVQCPRQGCTTISPPSRSTTFLRT